MRCSRSRLPRPPLLALLLVACGGPVQVSRSGAGAYEASLAVTPDGFAVAWYDTRDGRGEIYLRVLGPGGRPVGPEFRLTENPHSSYEADVQYVDSRFAVAWYNRAEPETYEAWLGVWTTAGHRLWKQRISSPDRNGRIPVLRARDGALFVAWLEDDAADDFEVRAGWWGLDGHELAAPATLAPAGPTTWNLNADIDRHGRAWVVFDATAGTRADEVFLAVVDAERARVVRLTEDDGVPSKYPDVAIGPGRVAVTWQEERHGPEEVYMVVAAPESFDGAVEHRARRITFTAGPSIGAYIAWNGERLGLAWSDHAPGPRNLHFLDFDLDGSPLGPTRRVTRSRQHSSIPAIRPWRDGFALAWNEYWPTGPEPHQVAGRSEVFFTRVR